MIPIHNGEIHLHLPSAWLLISETLGPPTLLRARGPKKKKTPRVLLINESTWLPRATPPPRGKSEAAFEVKKKELGKGDGEFSLSKSLCFPEGCGAWGGQSHRETTLTETVWPGSVQPGAALVPVRRPPGWNLVPGGSQFHRGLVQVGSNFPAAWLQFGVHFARTWLQACFDFAAAWYQSGAHLVRAWLPARRVCVCVGVFG